MTSPTFDTPPDELANDPLAHAEWTRVAPLLRRSGIITEAERMALIALCQQWSRYRQAQQHVLQEGLVFVKPNGVPMTNRYLTVADQALVRCLRLWQELGLTPASRARMMALPVADEAPVSKWVGLA